MEIGAKYTIVGPDGTSVVFNDPTDANHVGFLTDVAGLDSPEVRENAENVTEGDGGYHGDFYYGRRSIVLDGIIDASDASVFNVRRGKIARATDAMRADCELKWTEQGTGRGAMRVLARRQNFRFSNRRPKNFQIALVCASHRIESQTVQTLSDAVAPLSIDATNGGNYEAKPIVKVHNTSGVALVSPITIQRAGVNVVRINYALPTGRRLDIDFAAKTVVDDTGANRYSTVDFAVTNWNGVLPGTQAWTSDKGTALDVIFRDTWIG